MMTVGKIYVCSRYENVLCDAGSKLDFSSAMHNGQKMKKNHAIK